MILVARVQTLLLFLYPIGRLSYYGVSRVTWVGIKIEEVIREFACLSEISQKLRTDFLATYR